MSSDPKSRIQATRDTRPLTLDELQQDRGIIEQIHALLRAMHDDFATRRGKAPTPQDPYCWVDVGRTHRVVLLDGPRGVGKTSMLVTLLHHWRRAWSGSLTSGLERDLFGDTGELLRALPILDFNPHPPGVHPYAWILQSFLPLVQACSQVSHTPRGPDLSSQWAELYQAALLVWSTSGDPHRGDVIEFVEDQRVGQAGWHRLQATYRTFIDGLTTNLEAAGKLPINALLVLPIDDLDLNPHLAQDLLLALRKLRHDRVVFLLTGHRLHLRQVLGMELCGELRETSRAVELGSLKRLTEHLAHDLVDKVLPVRNAVSLPMMTIEGALRFDAGSGPAWERLGDKLSEEVFGGGLSDVRAYLDRIHGGLSEARLFRARDMVELAGKTGVDLLKGILCAARDELGLPWLDLDAAPRLKLDEAQEVAAGPILVGSAGSRPTVLESTRPRLLLKGKGTEAPPFVAWLSALTAVPGLAIEGIRIVPSDDSPFVATVDEFDGQTLVHPWPDPAPPRTVAELTARADEWRKLRGLDTSEPAAVQDLDQLLLDWIYLHASQLVSLERPGNPQDDQSVWLRFANALVEGIETTPYQWLQTMAELLAPEFGLPLKRIDWLGTTLFDLRPTTRSGLDKSKLSQNRLQRLRRSFGSSDKHAVDGYLVQLGSPLWWDRDWLYHGRTSEAWYTWRPNGRNNNLFDLDNERRSERWLPLGSPTYSADRLERTPPSDATTAISRFVDSHDARSTWLALFEDHADQFGVSDLSSVMIKAWRWLLGLGVSDRGLRAELDGWWQLNDDDVRYQYNGPQLVLQPAVEHGGPDLEAEGIKATAYGYWTCDPNPFPDKSHDALVGWMGIMQSHLVNLDRSPKNITICVPAPLRCGELEFAPYDFVDWNLADAYVDRLRRLRSRLLASNLKTPGALRDELVARAIDFPLQTKIQSPTGPEAFEDFLQRLSGSESDGWRLQGWDHNLLRDFARPASAEAWRVARTELMSKK